MLESIEGKRGVVRAKPPIPALQGLFGQPTVINNVISFASVPLIMARGAAFYKGLGHGKSTGTLPIQLTGNIRRGGLVEVRFGISLRELLFEFGGGSASGRPIKAGKLVARSVAMCPNHYGICLSITKPMRQPVQLSVMAALWCMTIVQIFPNWRATPWNFAQLNPVVNVRLAALVLRVVLRSSIVWSPHLSNQHKSKHKKNSYVICATPCNMVHCAHWAA